MTDRTYIPTKEVAKLIREALKREYPGVKFSVRCGTGTGSAWISVHYTDGPVEAGVREVARAYEGRSFNGMTDGYDDNGTDLVWFPGESMPTEVRFGCDGVNTSREVSPAAVEYARGVVREHLGRDAVAGDAFHFAGEWIDDRYGAEWMPRWVAGVIDFRGVELGSAVAR